MNKQVFLENVIIITGASSGIGQHLALRLAEQSQCQNLIERTVEEYGRISIAGSDRFFKPENCFLISNTNIFSVEELALKISIISCQICSGFLLNKLFFLRCYHCF